jgi:AraC-like DNA-binding protein
VAHDRPSVPHDLSSPRAADMTARPNDMTERPDDGAGGDTLSEVLSAVRLRGAVFFTIDASAPWAIEAPPADEITAPLIPGAEHLMEFHLIRRGRCWAAIPGQAAVELEAGDVIMFPQGDGHVLSSAPGMRGRPDPDGYAFAGVPMPVTVKAHGGGDPAEVICGFLGCDARPFNPLLSALPRVIHLPRENSGGGVIESFVNLALAESTASRPGSESVLARLSELLFIEVVRRYLATLPPENVGWLAGLRDEGVGRALTLMHARPTHDWSLDELAREAGMSRSVLAERFAHFVGVPPMQYLAQWRMQLAASLLTGTSMSLAEIADQVGYGSETALSRAYKRWVGVAPADFRRGKRGALAAES